MRIKGLDWMEIKKLTQGLDLIAWEGRILSYGPPPLFSFKLKPVFSHSYYSTYPYRRGVCFHGWRDFIRVAFASGACYVSTALGRWRSSLEFDRDLPRLQNDPRLSGSCDHCGPLPAFLARAVQNAQAESQSAREVVSHAL